MSAVRVRHRPPNYPPRNQQVARFFSPCFLSSNTLKNAPKYPFLTQDYGILRNTFWPSRSAKSCYHTLQYTRLSENYGILRNFFNHVHSLAKPHTGHTGSSNSFLFLPGDFVYKKQFIVKIVQTLYTCHLHQHNAPILSHKQKYCATHNTFITNNLRLKTKKVNIY